MKILPRLAVVAGTAFVPVAAASAADVTAGTIVIEHPWTRATPPGARVAGGYLVLENLGSDSDRLTGLSSPAADRVEIHEMAMDGGVMTMRPVEDGLDLPPGQGVALEPGGLHLMLIDLKSGLTEGQSVPVTLTFAKGGTAEIELAVQPMGAKAPTAGHAMQHGSE
ncbi:copper chaperone PCu(A)C [Marinivivus vitaminiproducens]|uniref:copper chaperone PCu(A)C n=1 Tax=Marinivivus vitaminiproducens TaxID=3035935 RepID=UPI0027A10BEE|nr:copper chaperone PCu(A)C [Geminicoccaceae bacterium SCSIO 64248]